MIRNQPGGSEARSVVVFGGIDPGGGAGIAADIRAGSLVGVLVAPIPAVLTVQSTSGLESVRDVDARWILAAALKVFRDQRVGCIKTGAIGGNGQAIAEILQGLRSRGIPVVVDPVILPTLQATGEAGTKRSSLSSLRALERLLPLASLVTPNGPEAERFSGIRVHDEKSASLAAEFFVEKGARAVLLKGGHWGPPSKVTDVFLMKGKAPLFFRSRRTELRPVHGGGCTLASLIAAEVSLRGPRRRLTEGDWRSIVLAARRRHQKLLQASIDVGGRLRVLVETRKPSGARARK